MAGDKLLSLSTVKLGSGKNTPQGNEVALKDVKDSYEISEIKATTGSRVHISVLCDNDEKSYEVFEIGFFTKDEKLIYYLSTEESEPLSYKVKNQNLILSFDIETSQIPSEKINLQVSTEKISLDTAEDFARIANSFQSLAERQLDYIIDKVGF